MFSCLFESIQIFITNLCQSYWTGAVVISVGHYKNNSRLNLFMKLLLSELLSSQDVMLAMCSGTAAWDVKGAAFAAVSYCKKIHLHPPKHFPHKHIWKRHLYKFCHLCFTFEIHRLVSYLQKLVWKCIMSSQNNQVDQVGLNGLNQGKTYQRIWEEHRNVFFFFTSFVCEHFISSSFFSIWATSTKQQRVIKTINLRCYVMLDICYVLHNIMIEIRTRNVRPQTAT